MPENVDLDERLARSRAEVLQGIDQPPLTELRRRGAARRGRRRAGLAVLAVAATAGVLLVRGPGVDRVAPVPPAGLTDGAARYTAEGITVAGLPGEVPDRPGLLTTVEFTDPLHGYGLLVCPPEPACAATVARTEDGGGSWSTQPLPAGFAASTLLGFRGGGVTVAGGSAVLVAERDGAWTTVPRGPDATVAVVGADQQLVVSPAAAGRPARLQVWDPRRGPVGDLAHQPPGDIGSVGSGAAGDGLWWAGTVRDGQPELAISRDSGASWQSTALPLPDGRARRVQAAVSGSQMWVTVTGESTVQGYAGSPVLRGVFHSVDAGRTFTATRRLGTGDRPADPWHVTGDLVPLPDGRLLAVGPGSRWYVSADNGAAFRHAAGTLPAVRSLRRTQVGYVAEGLFNAGWAAYSTDGLNWRKLGLR